MQVLFLVGPTAVGKTEVAFLLAKKMKAEIISCDSMQVYREIDILNAKPEKKLREEVSHHLIDIVSVREEFDVARFYRLAREKIEEILKRGRKVICVGGSGMYVSILLDGIFVPSCRDDKLRDSLKKLASLKGNLYLYKELEKIDPRTAGKIHWNDLKRIIRALEVYRLTGIPLSRLKSQREGIYGKYRINIVGLRLPRKILYELINKRVEEMFAKGVVEEIRAILNKRVSLTFRQMIGYEEIVSYLKGRLSLEEVKRRIKRDTRRFAKRQFTWFNKDGRIEWIDIEKFTDPREIAHHILNLNPI